MNNALTKGSMPQACMAVLDRKQAPNFTGHNGAKHYWFLQINLFLILPTVPQTSPAPTKAASTWLKAPEQICRPSRHAWASGRLNPQEAVMGTYHGLLKHAGIRVWTVYHNIGPWEKNSRICFLLLSLMGSAVAVSPAVCIVLQGSAI